MLQGSAGDGYFCRMAGFYRVILVFLFLTISPLSSLGFTEARVWAAHPSENLTQWGEWEGAKNLFDSQRFQEALQALQEKPLESPNYYYNLGTVYYKLTQIGPAIAYLEKANRLRPRDSDIQHNLSIARTVLGQAIGVDKMDPASNALEQLADQISLDEVRALMGFFGMAFLLVWLRAYLTTRSIRKVFTTPLGNIGLAGLILTSCIFGLEKWSSTTPPAISIQRHSVRSGPGEHYSELAKLEPGSKVRLLSTSTESSTDLPGTANSGKTQAEPVTWQQVRFTQQGVGWVKISSLLVL